MTLLDIPYDGRTAAVRYNNPGAQYPSEAARRFGMEGYGIIGGGHKIAKFPTEAHGAAANMDNFARNYRGMSLADAVAKWRGGNGSVAVPAGFDPSARVDDAFLGDRDRMARFFDAMARHEGRGAAGPIAPEVWQQAYDLYRPTGGAVAAAPTPAHTVAQAQPAAPPAPTTTPPDMQSAIMQAIFKRGEQPEQQKTASAFPTPSAIPQAQDPRRPVDLTRLLEIVNNRQKLGV